MVNEVYLIYGCYQIMKHFFIVYTHQSLLLHMRGKTKQETTLEYISNFIQFELNILMGFSHQPIAGECDQLLHMVASLLIYFE